jgi:hypothetical protein
MFYFKFYFNPIMNSGSRLNNVSSQIHLYLEYVDSNSFIILTLHFFSFMTRKINIHINYKFINNVPLIVNLMGFVMGLTSGVTSSFKQLCIGY